MSNKYCQALVELRNKPAHELKEVGDQWRTPDNIFWGINTLFGPFVLDLFTDGDNAKCAAYYTAEDNALAHDWSERLAELKGAAFGNPPYSRASQHEGQYITGMRYIMKHASAMRDKGGRYVFLIKAATSEVWWPEDADHIAFIRGRIGFELPAWFIPKDEKQVPTGAFFAGAIAVFDKTWKGPAISYIGRDELEACGEAFLAQVRQQAEKLVREMAAWLPAGADISFYRSRTGDWCAGLILWRKLMRDIQMVLERWGAWAANNHEDVTWSSIAAGFKGLIPSKVKSRPQCCDDDAMIICGCMARLKKNNSDLHDLLVDYYVVGMTFMSLAGKHCCSDGYIGKRLQKAEGIIEGMLMALDIRLEMDIVVNNSN